jgi:hypothetical protein
LLLRAAKYKKRERERERVELVGWGTEMNIERRWHGKGKSARASERARPPLPHLRFVPVLARSKGAGREKREEEEGVDPWPS